MKRFLRKYFTLFLLGVVLGVVVACIIAPSLLAWWNAPSVAAGVTCEAAVRWAAERMMWTQGIAAAIGGLLFMLIGAAFRGKAKPPAANNQGGTPMLPE